MQQKDLKTIKVVYAINIIYIRIYDSPAKEVKDNIVAITFRRDKIEIFTSIC